MNQSTTAVGWREWVTLPELKLPPITAKIDSGKQASILHTFVMERFEKDGTAMVRFGVHPHQNDKDMAVMCEAPILRESEGKSSEGDKETHYIIQTTVRLGEQEWPIELLLAKRDEIKFRLLLGHSAIDKRVIIDPSESFLLGEPEAL